MKLPAKVEYAFKAVFELAIRYRYGNDPVPLNVIYKSQQIPKKFLVQLLLRLKNAGIVFSSRGVAGGYRLAKHPSNITLSDVIKAVDSSILDKPDGGARRSDSDRLIYRLWDDINHQVAQQLETSFEDWVEQLQGEPLSYQI